MKTNFQSRLKMGNFLTRSVTIRFLKGLYCEEGLLLLLLLFVIGLHVFHLSLSCSTVPFDLLHSVSYSSELFEVGLLQRHNFQQN
jgi:hypothetical protein